MTRPRYARGLVEAAPGCVERAPRFGSYFGEGVPPAPPCEYLAGVDLPMWSNDRIADCTVASFAALVAAWTHAIHGTATILAEADVLAAYGAISGWTAADPLSDLGAREPDVIAYLGATGVAGHRITGHAHLGVEHNLLHAAIWLFGGASLDLALPGNAEEQAEAGAWTITGPAVGELAPGAGGLHEAVALGVGESGYYVRTWGRRVVASRDWMATYCRGGWAFRSMDFVDYDGRLVANGVDVEAWNADLARLGDGG